MEIDARDAVAMGPEDRLDGRLVIDVRPAFVVDDHIVTLGVIRVAKHRQLGAGAAIVNVDDVNLEIGPLFEAALEKVLLFGVIMAATARDEQRL